MSRSGWHSHAIKKARNHPSSCACSLCLKKKVWDASGLDLCLTTMTLDYYDFRGEVYDIDLRDIKCWEDARSWCEHLCAQQPMANHRCCWNA